MLATELIQKLQKLVQEVGDLPVTTGLGRTGYGEEILNALHATTAKNGSGEVEPVIDLAAADESFVAIGGF